MRAKQILLDMCTDATVVPRCTRVARTIKGIRISLTLNSLTDGDWFMKFPDGEHFSTSSVTEAEIKLAEWLEKVEQVMV
jgi:hypothetical protein